MKYWSRLAATGPAATSAGAATPAGGAGNGKPSSVEDQFKALVELTIHELTTARRELAEEAKKMRAAASAPNMAAAGNGRCRSLSSTWETTDSDDVGDDESDVEEYDGDDPMSEVPRPRTHRARSAAAAAAVAQAEAAEAARRRDLFASGGGDDDDDDPEESKDAFYDLVHARDVASLSRGSGMNSLPILRRLAGARSHSHSSSADADVDPTTATYPIALPAMRVSGRRRSNSQNARSRRRRTRSESAASAVGTTVPRSSGSGGSGSGGQNRERRLRIISPIGSKLYFSGWVRGQPAEVRWEVFDKSVEFVRIELCNIGWKVPTTVALQVPNDGLHEWKRVVWGLPIEDGYYVNIYDATAPAQVDSEGKLPLLAQSERFAVTG
ncbi:hypothetical protein PybrP1_004014 [[Pythium] brassicae (nom. inval.)]|nr:hypothetical protein PybrP1_004014 [[Pythium] brassicae (nom. inval.)]